MESDFQLTLDYQLNFFNSFFYLTLRWFRTNPTAMLSKYDGINLEKIYYTASVLIGCYLSSDHLKQDNQYPFPSTDLTL